MVVFQSQSIPFTSPNTLPFLKLGESQILLSMLPDAMGRGGLSGDIDDSELRCGNLIKHLLIKA